MATKTSITIILPLLFLSLISRPAAAETCPRDALKISACANVLNLINLNLGAPAIKPCCSLLLGLIDLDVPICLCTALKLSVLGINLNTPIYLNLAINACGGNLPGGFLCPVP